MLVTQAEIQKVKENSFVVWDNYTFSSKNEVFGGYIRNTVNFRRFHAPASCLKSRQIVAGDILIDEHPVEKMQTNWIINRPQNWLTTGAIVYLKNCFDLGKVARFFGFESPVEDVIWGKRNPLGEVKMYPLTIVKIDEIDNSPSSNYGSYVLTDGQKTLEIPKYNNPKFEFCWLQKHEERLKSYNDSQRCYAQYAQAKRDACLKRREDIKNEYKKKVEAHAKKVQIGTKLQFGTNFYEVIKIENDLFHLKHWRDSQVIDKYRLKDFMIFE